MSEHKDEFKRVSIAANTMMGGFDLVSATDGDPTRALNVSRTLGPSRSVEI